MHARTERSRGYDVRSLGCTSHVHDVNNHCSPYFYQIQPSRSKSTRLRKNIQHAHASSTLYRTPHATPTRGPVRAYQGPWAARSSVVGRWAGGRAATLLLATLWPLRSALGPHQEARSSSISKSRLVAASCKPRRAGREAPCHAPWRSRGWLWTSLHAR